MRRERRNLSSSVTRLEDKFAKIDAVEKQLNERKKAAGSNQRKANTTAKDPEMEQANFTSADLQTGDAKSFKSTQVIRSRESVLRSQVHDQIAHSLSAVKSQVQSFLTQQQEAKSLPVDTAPQYQGTPRAGNATENIGGQSDQFVELFMDEKSYETRVQLGLIAKMVAPKPPSGPAKRSNEGNSSGPRSGSMTMTRPGTAKNSSGGSPIPQSNRQIMSTNIYVNQTPIQIKPGFLRASSRPKTSGLSRNVVGSRRPNSSGPRNLFPSLGGSRSAKPTIHGGGGGEAEGALGGGSLSLAAKLAASKDAVYTKEFYHLHVRILHSVSKLEAWEFDVVITDITYPNATKRHSIRNLRVNPGMYIVFHPPNNVVLSPVDDIPWVTSPESLFEHTLRIEVHSTYPNRTQVIDNVVFFGDTAPVELAIGK